MDIDLFVVSFYGTKLFDTYKSDLRCCSSNIMIYIRDFEIYVCEYIKD